MKITKSKKMPTALMLLVLSYLIAILGLTGAGVLIVSRFGEVRSLIAGILILVGALSLAAALRMFANIGQILFELNTFLFNDLKSLLSGITQHIKNIENDSKAAVQSLSQNIAGFRDDSHTQIENLRTELQKTQLQSLETLKTQLEQLGCDSKDISQNINQIKVFFEQIERHLDLKK